MSGNLRSSEPGRWAPLLVAVTAMALLNGALYLLRPEVSGQNASVAQAPRLARPPGPPPSFVACPPVEPERLADPALRQRVDLVAASLDLEGGRVPTPEELYQEICELRIAMSEKDAARVMAQQKDQPWYTEQRDYLTDLLTLHLVMRGRRRTDGDGSARGPVEAGAGHEPGSPATLGDSIADIDARLAADLAARISSAGLDPASYEVDQAVRRAALEANTIDGTEAHALITEYRRQFARIDDGDQDTTTE